MQNLPIYLYPNTLDAILDLDATIRGVNQVMYQRDLKIQKGIKNQVRVQFKNSDQKKVTIYNTQTFVFSMFDAVNQRLIVEKNLQVLDQGTTATRGIALLTLSESDTLDLDRSSYQYSVKLLDTDGSYTPAYSNTYYSMNGTLHLSNDIFPVLTDSTTVTTFNPIWNDDTKLYENFSGNLYASPEYNGNTALHTVAFYLTAYKGTIIVEGTLDNTPGSSNNYAPLVSTTYNGETGVQYVNFNGVFTYIRIKHIPAKGPLATDNQDTSYSGTLDKVLYRS
jgi:hypothetical protein